MPSLPGLKEVVERTRVNPIEIGDALRKANESYSGLMKLLAPYINIIDREIEVTLKGDGPLIPNPRSRDLECLLDLLDEYVKAEPRDRKTKLGLFEEAYQMNPGEAMEFLKYLGLEV